MPRIAPPAKGKRAALAPGLPRFRFAVTSSQGLGATSSREPASGSSRPSVSAPSTSAPSASSAPSAFSRPCTTSRSSATSSCSSTAAIGPAQVLDAAGGDWDELAARLAHAKQRRVVVPAVARSTAPVLAGTVRGNRAAALSAAATGSSRKAALNSFMGLMVAPSATASQDSLLRTWQAFHTEWFGETEELLPLTPAKIFAVCAMFRAGGYRAVENYVARAKDWHIEHGYPWSDFLSRACRKSKRAATRGIGPARQSAPLDLELVHRALQHHSGQPVCRGGPLGIGSLVTCGSFWMLRELEASCALVRHITVDKVALTVEWLLPVSKTDVKALGCARRWGCVCAGNGKMPCPVHAVLTQLRLLEDTFGQDRVSSGELPLFPTVAGRFVEKCHVVSSIEAAATLCDEPLEDAQGSRRFGGHSLRVTGARTLAGLGVDIHLIQLMARWSSDVVLRYVAEAPLSSITEAYRHGYATQLARGPGLLGEAIPEPSSCVLPLPPSKALVHKGPWIENLDSGIVHRPAVWSLEVQPLSWRTACGWAFGHSNTRSVDKLPAKASRRCSCCWKATAATSDAAASNSDSSSSSSSCAS